LMRARSMAFPKGSLTLHRAGIETGILGDRLRSAPARPSMAFKPGRLPPGYALNTFRHFEHLTVEPLGFNAVSAILNFLAQYLHAIIIAQPAGI
jgi:hypothetical protein